MDKSNHSYNSLEDDLELPTKDLHTNIKFLLLLIVIASIGGFLFG